MVFSEYMPSNGISGSYNSSIFSVLGASIVFSTVALSIYICGIWKNGIDEPTCRDADVENRYVDMEGEGRRHGMGE